MKDEDKIECFTPTPGKKSTRIVRWKYELVRDAILKVLPEREPGLPFRELAELVRRILDESSLNDIGSVSWYTTTVKLHLETIGEVSRIPNSSPQRLLRKP